MPIRFLSLFLIGVFLLPGLARAATYTPHGDVIGAIRHYVVKHEDNLYDIARRFDIGIVELLVANPGVDPWEPKEGSELAITAMHVLPPIRHGVVVNLSELRLFYFAGDHVMTFPIGIGRDGWQTPLGETAIVKKRTNPTWIPPASIRDENPRLPAIFPAGPDNPLGAFALNLGWPSYAIHGTNRPYGVGKRSSHGCIRLYPEDIEILFNAVDIGTPVTIIDAPYKLGWQGTTLYLEITPTQTQSDRIADYQQPEHLDMPDLRAAIVAFAGENVRIDWHAVEEAQSRRNGIPTAISRKEPAVRYHR